MKFKIAEIAIELKDDETPIYWVYNYGFHPGQGGMEFVYGNFGTPDFEASIDFVNEFAPEHLEVLVDEPMDVLPKLNNVGEILLGKYSPITIGNFSLGVNAILPTGGLAKTFSCVTVYDFLKRTSIGHVTKKGYDKISGIAQKFAEYEGFDAHANAIRKRKI